MPPSQRVATVAASILLCAAFGRAQLFSIETPSHRLVFYDKNQTYLAPHLMRSFEAAWQFHQKMFHYQPAGKVTTLLEDFGDYGHGGADVIPRNRLNIGIAPFSYVYETMPANDRLSWMMNHELAHVAEMDGASRRDRLLRRVFFGKVSPSADDPVSMAYGYLTTPRRYSPRWYHEGLAVFMETWMSGGVGRALGGYDEMVFRAMVRDRSRIYDVVGLEAEGSAIDFQVGANSYLYGTRFFTWLASQHGQEKVIAWVRRDDSSKRYFSAQFRNVFGRPLQQEWSRWIGSEHEWQNANLKLIRQYPVTPLERITGTTLGSVSRAYYDEHTGTLYAAVRYPGQMAHIAAIDVDTGRIQKLHDVEGPALYYVCSLAYDREGRRLFYSTINNNLRDLNVLDLKTRKSRLLIRQARTGDLAFNPADQSLWGVRHANGLSALVRIAPPYNALKVVRVFPYGTDAYDLDVSPDGQYLTAASVDPGGNQKLVSFRTAELLAGETAPEVIHDFEFSSPADFVFSADGRYLYGTSYYSGASDIFRIDFRTREMAVLSNAETGLFRPVPLADGSLIAFEYTAAGFVPVKMHPSPLEDVSAVKYLGQQVVEKQPVVKNWRVDSAASVNLAELTQSAGRYRPFRNMRLMSAYPVVQGYKDTGAAGLRLDVSDDLKLSSLEASLSFSPAASLPAAERLHFGFNYRYWAWTLSGYYNNADFYDLFGPTKTSRKGYALKLENSKYFIYRPPRTLELNWSLAAYGGMERLPEYQNVAAGISRMLSGKASLTYKYTERSLGAVDDEKGYVVQLNWRGRYARSSVYPAVYANADYGFLTPLHNSPVWIRNSVGRAFGDPGQPFANFYFGGFGNNWIDKNAVSRYREYYSFPGVDLNAIGAHDYAKSMVEWSLPPIRFRRLGTTWLYCNWSRLVLFSSGLVGNLSGVPERAMFANAGAQLDFRIVLFSYLNSTFSAGYAAATDRHGKLSKEFMVSLKLL